MKFLLDTHSFLWFIGGNRKLSLFARELIQNPEKQPLLSTVSLWEIALKVSIGKLNLKRPFEDLIPEQMKVNGIELLPIEITHLTTLSDLPFHHRDPFDRLLIAQAMVEKIPILSIDKYFDNYPVKRLW